MIKIGTVSLGCPRAVVDFETALGRLAKGRYRIIQNPATADVIILNTCGFIESAKRESLEAIFQAVAQKNAGRVRRLIVMGCLSQRYGLALRRQIPEIDAIVGADDYGRLERILKELETRSKIFSVRPNPRYLPGGSGQRVLLGPAHTAYVKISDGCINRCSYCAIGMIRGSHRFRSMGSICGEIERLSQSGRLSEIIVVGQDTAAYGFDQQKRFKLAALLSRLAESRLVPWIRVLYAHPAHVTDELIEVMGRYPSICRYIDLPIEHSHDEILSRMNRRLTRSTIERVVEQFRRRIPGMAIRTSVMVGFPGETDRHFRDLLEFIQRMRFDRLGVFEYSKEEGTPAFKMRPQIPARIKKLRADQIMAAQMQISKERNQGFLGKSLTVLVDFKKTAGTYSARTQYDAPEIDGQVYLKSSKLLKSGDFVCAKIFRSDEYDLFGKVVDESRK
jgi:ribosomal protein S12 methylthiotransferase